ncbi:helix-turn-helix transcriptional regulator [Fusibacter paucivorans]|uniref:Helix-turn-helix transcriptional regulator n=1 Tax=Fusibacter paucivorans TaxID=76009 RepID=A0ABS5PK44_9FIRM|nr:LuxR C-terminal-related transcriptional regulator [Fusibacter paucivorans]MBS7525237.1 helix-turn-helix transcriptional regulator [Fusibacter paucivorans]
MNGKSDQTKQLYFTPRLLETLKSIWEYPLTIVEAPMGYGKTTAVKHFLEHTKADVLWLKVYDELIDHFWDEFSTLFGNYNESLYQRFIQVGFPNDAVSLRETLKLMGTLNLVNPCVLVIDDYHLIDSPELNRLITTLAANEVEGLHIVLTGRYTKLHHLEELSLKGILHHVTKESLEMTENEIIDYYHACGVIINEKQAKWLFDATEGWISALYLMLLSYLKDGVLEPPESIYKLIEKIVYTPLDDDAKALMTMLSIFDNFTLKQAVFIWDGQSAVQILENTVQKNTFINYDVRTKNYQIHSLFREYLREVFETKPSDFKMRLYRQAAAWYSKQQDFFTARQFWYRCGDFEAILQSIKTEKVKNSTAQSVKALYKYVKECPPAIKGRYPYALLILAMHMTLHNEFQIFGQLCREAAENAGGFSEAQRQAFYGELELMQGIAAFNDLDQMAEHFDRAWALLGTATSVFDTNSDWSHGSPSILYLYYRESGKLQTHLKTMIEKLPHYRRLTRAHGNGAEIIMEAECYYHRGDFVNAEISLNKAMHMAQSSDQWSIELSGIYLQMRIDLMKQDYQHMFELLHRMREEMTKRVEYQYLHKVELCEISFYAQLDQKYKIPDSLGRPEQGDIRLLYANYGMFNIIYGRVMLINERYTKILGSVPHFLQIASIFPTLLSSVYTYLYSAAANWKLKRIDDAREDLKKALAIAMPDQLYMPFVENGDYLEPLVKELVFSDCYREDATYILMLYKTYADAKEAVKQKYFPEDKDKLTDREYEVALLASKGYTNKEIAEKLYISQNTVKFALKSVFAKLAIGSRALLKQYFGKTE